MTGYKVEYVQRPPKYGANQSYYEIVETEEDVSEDVYETRKEAERAKASMKVMDGSQPLTEHDLNTFYGRQ